MFMNETMNDENTKTMVELLVELRRASYNMTETRVARAEAFYGHNGIAWEEATAAARVAEDAFEAAYGAALAKERTLREVGA